MTIHRDLLGELEEWKCGHKARAASISIDNGYGASCWSVELCTEHGVIAVQEVSFFETGEPEGELERHPFYLSNDGVVCLFVNEKDWVSLYEVLALALDAANAWIERGREVGRVEVSVITETIDDLIDDWHASQSELPLHRWLGMTEKEYAMFVAVPSVCDVQRLALVSKQLRQKLYAKGMINVR